MVVFRILLFSAAYFEICRELRFILESIAQAYYLDTEYSELGLKGKLGVLREMQRSYRATGQSLIDSLDLKEHIRKEMRDLHKLLSEHVHPGYKEFLPLAKKESIAKSVMRFTPKANPELIRLSCGNLNRVMDLVYLLCIFRFLPSPFFTNAYSDLLGAMNCSLSVKALGKSKE